MHLYSSAEYHHNKNEFITLKEEIENLKNYVLINQIRYGNQVNVDFYVTPDCEEQKVPKLILQPLWKTHFSCFSSGRKRDYLYFCTPERWTSEGGD